MGGGGSQKEPGEGFLRGTRQGPTVVGNPWWRQVRLVTGDKVNSWKVESGKRLSSPPAGKEAGVEIAVGGDST